MRLLLPLCLMLCVLAACSRSSETKPEPGETPAATIGDDEASSLQAEADASLKSTSSVSASE